MIVCQAPAFCFGLLAVGIHKCSVMKKAANTLPRHPAPLGDLEFDPTYAAQLTSR